MTFDEILKKYRSDAENKFALGMNFELLMKNFLQVYPMYRGKFSKIFLWNEFPYRDQISNKDIGIDLVAETFDGEFWAIQCKFFTEDAEIDKPSVDSFITTSGMSFKVDGVDKNFSLRLWIDTTIKGFGRNAKAAIKNQNPPVIRIGLNDLQNADVDWKEIYESTKINESVKIRELRDFQKEAVEKVHKHLKKNERGRLIMACGSGKTFTSLKIAENEAGDHGIILFLVPSIALLAQTFSEWNTYSKKPIDAICVCSDETVKTQFKRSRNAEFDEIIDVEIPIDLSKSVEEVFKKISAAINRKNDHYGLKVVFSTYQSLGVIAEVQKNLKFEFDLIICDEAHRTAGFIKNAKSEDFDPLFTRIHDGNFIKAKHRLYMTATPRLFKIEDDSKKSTNKINDDITIWSMDDENIFGEEIYKFTFAQAIQKGVLSDYKIMLFTISDQEISEELQKAIKDKNQEINIDDTAKLIGCLRALSKLVSKESEYMILDDPNPMKTAVAFCQRIEDSKYLKFLFEKYANDCVNSFDDDERNLAVNVKIDHIDGKMNAGQRREKLYWLKNVSKDENSHECRILTNARCLSEGIDVPTLDAVIFMSAKKSIIDIVQAVGRVMRRAEGKKYGYIIIPIVIPTNLSPDDALSQNKKYEVIWEIINALRSHDERLDWLINKIRLNHSMEPVMIIEHGRKNKIDEKSQQITLNFEALKNAILVKIVDKLANSKYWQTWGNDVAKIAERHKKRISELISIEGDHKTAFYEFVNSLRKNLNPSINESDAIDMLSQHLITRPVFEALFENYSFMDKNAVSKSMDKIIKLLDEDGMQKELKKLEGFYNSVRGRCSNIQNSDDRQRIIIDLYDKFFKIALPKTVEKLGIVYTPFEVVDFILNSVNDVLKQEFNSSLSTIGVKILDPFSGTGTFLARLIETGLIDKNLTAKYQNDLYANEIVLLAYYISCINIENAYHSRSGDENYISFNKMCLTDTFQPKFGDLAYEMLDENYKNILNQQKSEITVIVGNPPYSIGQRSAMDNAQNQKYPELEKRIDDTYAKNSTANLKKALYDSYIKAFRWASDRIGNSGVIGFVTNAGWLDGAAMDGMRKCFENEFDRIYIFNLRGNQRTQGEISRKEGGKIFGSGSRAPIAITILVKNGNLLTKNAQIYYKEIENYLTREQKLSRIAQTRSILDKTFSSKIIKPNSKHDWINQRGDLFDNMIILSFKRIKLSPEKVFCDFYSLGIATNRDIWCYNFSTEELNKNIKTTISFYNYHLSNNLNELIFDSTKINWTRELKKYYQRKIKIDFDETKIVESYYRPFVKSNLYYDEYLNEMILQMPKLFPTGREENLLICISALTKKDFSVLISDKIVDLHFNGDTQCFPLYYYESPIQGNLFSQEMIRHDGITDYILNYAEKLYGNVTKEDIFYYVYGFLHLPSYREKFANELKKSLPRIKLVPETAKFFQISQAGRNLAEIHLNYENQTPPNEIIIEISKEDYKIYDKMRLSKDKTTLIYNPFITIKNLPQRSFEYIVNGRSPLEWIIDRYQVKFDSKSEILNDPNAWCSDHNDEKYIFNLILSLLTVSLKTLDIISTLPEIDFSL
ncbi:MAG: DEAD/DEAH box helicase [Selenomonadaceae bacterium]|nr:DEAD/DEAH box helicase [bacterium]MBR1730713.1 DEAD/DEAH box helicase [Selenomonadaceae bacterium]